MFAENETGRHRAMETISGALKWGIILCKNCGEVIDTLDTNKVTTFYGICGSNSCLEKNSETAHPYAQEAEI
jgi:hypothetical protein